MTTDNFAGNIIVNLASLPDFLRRPILKKRMVEFFSLSDEEKQEVISNALEAGPTIPFANFAKLFQTWLEILATLPEEQRRGLFSAYVHHITLYPHKLIAFNLDGILEIFLKLDEGSRQTIAATIRDIINGLDEKHKRTVLLIVHDNAKEQMGIS